MSEIRQLAVSLLVILVMVCIIQGELFWIEELEEAQILEEQTEQTVFLEYQQILEGVWEEVQYFPIPESNTNENATISFENSWLAERSYGGTRVHEGTDLMPSLDKAGYYPVVSMTDGVIEKVGWLEKGGWRIGVRSPNGNYYYYAHLHSYAKEWEVGTEVQAGEILGFMGDSGYGAEGTTGQFVVHLHVGIYLPLGADKELAANPYWILKYLENHKLSYSY